nr:CIA30 family protein [Thauera sp.]
MPTFDPAGHAVFSGQVAPDNNGGFASVRASVSPLAAGAGIGLG